MAALEFAVSLACFILEEFFSFRDFNDLGFVEVGDYLVECLSFWICLRLPRD